MNDQELPETGTCPPNVELANQAPVEEQVESIALHVEQSTGDACQDEMCGCDEFQEEDLSEEGTVEFEDEDMDEERSRSLMEELFDEVELGEEMSELDVLTLEEAAAYLRVEYGAIRRLLKEQSLPGRKIGEDWRFLRGAIADWLRAPGGHSAAPAEERPVRSDQSERRPERRDRQEFTGRAAAQDDAAQGHDGDRRGRHGSRYPQQGQGQGQGSRYSQDSRPPRRPRYGANEQQEEGGYQSGGGQGGYPPPRRPRFNNDQGQQAPQNEYRPPRRPQYGGGQFNQQEEGRSGGGSYGGNRFNGGPKKPKRRALNEQRFKRLDRRKFGDNSDGADNQDFGGDEG